MLLDVLCLQLHKMVVEDGDKEEDIGNIVSQSDLVAATAATTATAAASLV